MEAKNKGMKISELMNQRKINARKESKKRKAEEKTKESKKIKSETNKVDDADKKEFIEIKDESQEEESDTRGNDNIDYELPEDENELLALPGIGPYTAKAILIFADNKDVATIDTNIRRILIHHFSLSETTSESDLFEFAQKILPKGRSRDYHNGLMDYGATFLTSKKSGIKPVSQQSKFKGSPRYFRGLLMKKILAEPEKYIYIFYNTLHRRITLDEAKHICLGASCSVYDIINSLVKDELVTLQGNIICIHN